MSLAGVEGLADDPGAQPQRTMLAWNRTILATVLGALLVALTAERQQLPGVAAAAGLAAAGLLLMVLRDLRHWHHTDVSPWTPILHVGLAVAGLAALGVTVAVTGILMEAR